MGISGFLKKITKSPAVQNILKMLTGTMAGQIISVVMVPISARIYGSEMYGDLAVFTSATSLLTSFLGFGLSSAIMVEETDEKAQQTYKLAVYGTNTLIFIFTTILLLLKDTYEVINTSLPYSVAILFLAYAIMISNQINMLYSWLNRKGRFNILLFNPLITPLVNNGLVIILGIVGRTDIGLYVGLLMSQSVTLLHMILSMDTIEYKFNFRDIGNIFRRNRDFIMYQYPSTLVNGLVGNLPVQIMSQFFGNNVVGYYSMAMKLLSIPSGLLGNTVSRVYFKEVSDKQRNGESARKYTLKVSRIVMGLFLIPVIVILLLGEKLIPLLLGLDWEPSVIYIKIMAIWNLFSIAVNCTTGFTSVISKQKSNMVLAIIKLILFPSLMGTLSHLFNNPVVTVISYAITYSIINVVYYEFLIQQEQGLKYRYLKLNVLGIIICAFSIGLGQLIEKVF